jgi:methyl-accepting chemotaxis protein
MQMDSVTQQNAALVEETSAAAGSMQSQAEDMSDAISFFKTDAHSGHKPMAKSAPATASSSAKSAPKGSGVKPAASKPAPVAKAAVKTSGGDDWDEF